MSLNSVQCQEQGNFGFSLTENSIISLPMGLPSHRER